MFIREHNCSQKTDMNRASLSEMMDRGNPWYFMNVSDELVGGVDGRGFLPRRDEVRHLGGPVRHREYVVVNPSVSGDPWQPNDPVHSDGLPFLYG